jgi:hypothetical protein
LMTPNWSATYVAHDEREAFGVRSGGLCFVSLGQSASGSRHRGESGHYEWDHRCGLETQILSMSLAETLSTLDAKASDC